MSWDVTTCATQPPIFGWKVVKPCHYNTGIYWSCFAPLHRSVSYELGKWTYTKVVTLPLLLFDDKCLAQHFLDNAFSRHLPDILDLRLFRCEYFPSSFSMLGIDPSINFPKGTIAANAIKLLDK